MTSDDDPPVVLCPRCFYAVEVRRCYRVNFLPPVSPPSPPAVPPNQGLTDQHTASDTMVHSSPPPAYQRNTPTPPPEPFTSSPGPSTSPLGPSTPPPGLSTDPHPPEHEDNHTSQTSCRSSSSSFDSIFSQVLYNAEFLAELRAVEASYFSQQPPQASSPLPPSTSLPSTQSSFTAPSSPSTQSSLTMPSSPSSPTVEFSSTQPVSDEPSTTRRWVVFRGRLPGVYASS